jgi:hypothetical protein
MTILTPPGSKPRSPAAGPVNGESCGTCWYGKRVDPTLPGSDVLCRRKPPVPFLLDTPKGMKLQSFYPSTEHDEWCGDHLPRSSKRGLGIREHGEQ